MFVLFLLKEANQLRLLHIQGGERVSVIKKKIL